MEQKEVEKFHTKAKEIASALKNRLSEKIRIKINTHTDTDGITTGNIIAKCFNHYDNPFHISFGGPPKEEDLKELSEQKYDLFIFLDQGTGQFQMIDKHLLEDGKEVLILDHHPGKIEERSRLLHLNPHDFELDGAKDVSASGVAYSVIEKIDEKFETLSTIAIIGALGDRQETSTGFKGINKGIIEKAIDKDYLTKHTGLKLDGRSSPIIDSLTHSIKPFLLGLSGKENETRNLIEELGLDPETSIEELDKKDEEKLRDKILEKIEVEPTEKLQNSLWGTIYTIKEKQIIGPKNAHEYVTLLDSCEKLDKIETGFAALLGDKDSLKEAKKTLREYQEQMIESINWLTSHKEEIKTTNQMRYLDVEDKLKKKMVGEVLSIAIESNLIETDLPIIGLTKTSENKLKVSARATPEYAKNKGNIGKALNKVSEELGGSGGGHNVAAAARLPIEGKTQFIRKLDKYLENGPNNEPEKQGDENKSSTNP